MCNCVQQQNEWPFKIKVLILILLPLTYQNKSPPVGGIPIPLDRFGWASLELYSFVCFCQHKYEFCEHIWVYCLSVHINLTMYGESDSSLDAIISNMLIRCSRNKYSLLISTLNIKHKLFSTLIIRNYYFFSSKSAY